MTYLGFLDSGDSGALCVERQGGCLMLCKPPKLVLLAVNAAVVAGKRVNSAMRVLISHWAHRRGGCTL